MLDELNRESEYTLIKGDIMKYAEKIIKNASLISVQREDKLVAFIAYYDNDKKRDTAFLTMLAVKKTSRELSYGKKLLEFSVENLKNLGFKKYRLEVKKDNENAIHLYKKSGFLIESEKDDHYVMAMDL